MKIGDRSKAMAKTLRNALAEQQVNVSHSACLEIVARQLGFSSWNVLSAAKEEDAHISFTMFVEQGREQEAQEFYIAAFDGTLAHSYIHNGTLKGFDLKVGLTTISISCSNPKREAEPTRGGPFFPKSTGAVNTVFRLHVNDAEIALGRALAAGAILRDKVQIADTGDKVAVFFDPFGYIWAIVQQLHKSQRQSRSFRNI